MVPQRAKRNFFDRKTINKNQSGRLSPAAISPIDNSSSAFRAAAKAVSPGTVAPCSSPSTARAAFSRSSISLSDNGFLDKGRGCYKSARSLDPVSSRRHRRLLPDRPRLPMRGQGSQMHARTQCCVLAGSDCPCRRRSGAGGPSQVAP